jgi:hypothetical protein
MKQELGWGTAAAVAVVAAVGISSQPGVKPGGNPSAERQSGQTIVRSKAPKKGAPEKGTLPQCADSIPLLEHFFLQQKITGPPACYAEKPSPTPLDANFKTDFIIATLPDPLHTHFSLSFDRLVEAIQQAAQDEGYDYDSSWLPWDTEESSFNNLKDQDDAEDRKEKREDQPGILLFRRNSHSAMVAGNNPYQTALVVFIVGEESTRGIHRSQFENAVAWINALQQSSDKRTSVAILGPTFSGSFPSLAGLLTTTEGLSSLNGGAGFSVYSGSASSRTDAEDFAQTKGLLFRSFVQDDTTALDRVCAYFGGQDLDNLAILSEDETAYGHIVAQENFNTLYSTETCPGATKIYYPRDISTLRAAYQTQSMFSSGSGQLNQDNVQRKSLPTDLVDPTGQQHDTVRTYAGNQTPLSQEAQLLGIVDVLRTHRTKYVLVRSSNTLDPLFLANFLRRDYPEARIVVLNSDLLFQRGQDAMALSGVMTLSTYPLFSWSREWTALPPYDVHSHRVFPENFTEGTYIASRLLAQSLARANNRKPDLNCEFVHKDSLHPDVFVPPLRCQVTSPSYAPLPDYAPPFWTEDKACEPPSAGWNCRPATWLSVITKNGTWPLAALNEHTLDPKARGTNQLPPGPDGHQSWTGRTTKISLIGLCCLAIFQFLCCCFPSFTAKPAFRAHFATAGRRHTGLVLIGSCLIALMALFLGWGCGTFSTAPGPPAHTWEVWAAIVFVWVVTGAAVAINILATRKLNGNVLSPATANFRVLVSLALFVIFAVAFFGFWVVPLERALVLANRTFVYWRSMHLLSGVSPIIPFLALTAGFYVWFWYALHGLALFGPDRPCLPPMENLGVKLIAQPGSPGKELKLSMFSHENVAIPAERIATPLSWDNVIAMVTLFIVLVALMFGLAKGVPVRSLGSTRGTHYTLAFCLFLGFYCSFLLSEAWQIWRTWSSVRQLLVFLDRMALRRTLSALQGFSWGSVWKMSGNVLDVRYKLLSRQLECLSHLYNSLSAFKEPTSEAGKAAFAGVETCKKSVTLSRAEGFRFAEWYSKNYCKPDAADLQKFQDFQKQVAETTGVVLSELLVPATRVEKHSLIQVNPDDEREEDRKGPPPSKNELIRNAEELVCLTYMGFAQNLLGRIRTIVLGGVYMFIAACIAVSCYPFDPRTLLSGILLCLFVAFGGVVVFTYADMHRDATLSHITNTNPGELGSEFWFKVIGYGAAPLLGLLTQVFPEWARFLFSWLQPGLSSLK